VANRDSVRDWGVLRGIAHFRFAPVI